MIEINKITKFFPPMVRGIVGFLDLIDWFKGERKQIKALNDISINIDEGEILGLLGPNGAGKTTLCKILNALIIPTSGFAKVNGYDVIAEHREITKIMVTIFGGETEIHGVFGWRISVFRNLQFIGDLWGIPRKLSSQRIEEILHLLGLFDKKDEWYQKLSAGTKQKLFVAIPFILRLPVLILDEPTLKLDIETRMNLYELIKSKINREYGTTILLATNNLQEAEILCSRIAIIDNGELKVVNSTKNIIEENGAKSLEEAYLKMLKSSNKSS